MTEFKIGDKVRVIKCTGHFGSHGLEIGGIYKISDKHGENGFMLKPGGSSKHSSKNYVHRDEIELCTEGMFEDQWHLNDGKVEIPDDADKLEKDGSVVAFRKRKVKPFEFGDKVKHKDGNIYLVISKDKPGWYRIIKEGYISSVTAFKGNLTAIDD